MKPLAALALLALATASDAAAKRFGFQKFSASYSGGYTLVTFDGVHAGPAKIRIHAPRSGLSARITWKNTFYDETGSYTVATRWVFHPGGRFTASTIDPRHAWVQARGTFVLDKGKPVTFTATDASGTVTATGKLSMIGGGALGIDVTLTGLAEGAVTYGFSGSRLRSY